MKNQITEQNFNKELTKQNGITLIALVVTIIVLLILAGVTITLVLGENGIIAKAQRAKSATDEASAKEAVELAVGYVQAEAYTNNLNQEGIRAALQEELQKTDANATVSINGEGYTVTYKGYEFEIDSNFNVTIKQPFNAEEWDKTACKETSFIWESDNPEDGEAYHTIVGYADGMQNEVRLKIPSRCHEIRTDSVNYVTQGRNFAGTFSVIEFPNTIIRIGSDAFTNFELESVEIPNSVIEIGSDAFLNCTNLKNIKIPESIISCSGGAFNNTAWYNNQPDGLIYIGRVAYGYKGTKPSDAKIELKEGTKVIANYAFLYWNGLTNVTIPNTVNNIGEGAFAYCNRINNITIPDSVTMVGSDAFSHWESSQNINCKATSKPSTWDEEWDRACLANVVWGYTGE